MTKSKAQLQKEEMHHFNGAGCTIPAGRSVIVYLLKASRYNPETQERDVWALGVYSKGEYKAMRTHAKKHLAENAWQHDEVHEMETFLTL